MLSIIDDDDNNNNEETKPEVFDIYGFVVEEGVDEYLKQEKIRCLKEEENAKKWETLFLKYKRRDNDLFHSSKFKKLVEKGIPVQYPHHK